LFCWDFGPDVNLFTLPLLAFANSC
jgi:hypothetical protein